MWRIDCRQQPSSLFNNSENSSLRLIVYKKFMKMSPTESFVRNVHDMPSVCAVAPIIQNVPTRLASAAKTTKLRTTRTKNILSQPHRHENQWFAQFPLSINSMLLSCFVVYQWSQITAVGSAMGQTDGDESWTLSSVTKYLITGMWQLCNGWKAVMEHTVYASRHAGAAYRALHLHHEHYDSTEYYVPDSIEYYSW